MEQRIADFLINGGLYGKGLDISVEDVEELEFFLEGKHKIDAYCPECKTNRVFEEKVKRLIRKPKAVKTIMELPVNRDRDRDDLKTLPESYIFSLNKEDEEEEKQWLYDSLINTYPKIEKTYHCAKDKIHTLTFCLFIKSDSIIKYGQYPSLADLNGSETSKYRKLLGKENYTDYNRGIGLYSHGVGAGSLVYLRRIFEGLIEEAHKVASNQAGWDEEQYIRNRMNEKILQLKEFLPEYLVTTRQIYGVLSKGIHELDEDTCKKLFPVLRYGIEFILDEKLEREEREKKKKEIANSIQQFSSLDL